MLHAGDGIEFDAIMVGVGYDNFQLFVVGCFWFVDHEGSVVVSQFDDCFLLGWILIVVLFVEVHLGFDHLFELV